MKKIGLLLLTTWVSLLSYSQPFDHTHSETVTFREINLTETIRQWEPDKFLNIDIDNDGTNDLVFSFASEADNTYFIKAHPTTDQLSTKFLYLPSCHPKSLAAVINEQGQSFIEQNSGDWYGSYYGSGEAQVRVGENYCEIEPNFWNKGFKYLAVQFEINGNTHYAWILLKITNIKDVNDFMTLEVKSLAYETVPSQGIQAGDDGNSIATSITIQGKGGVNTITEDYGTLQMEANLLPVESQGRNILWSLRDSDKDFASISEEGKIQALKNGNVRVYAVVDDINQKIDSTDITITNQKIHLESLNILVKGGGDFAIDIDYGTLEFDVEFIPVNADESFKNITWKPSNGASSNQYVYTTIDSITGVVQAINDSEGTTRIVQFTAHSSDPNGTHEDFSVSISNQTKRLVSLDLTVVGNAPPAIGIDKGQLQLFSTAKPSFDFPIFWKVDNQQLATITPNSSNTSTAMVSALNNGTVKAICYWEDLSVNGRIVSDTLPVDISNQTPTGINDVISEQTPILYPNPASNHSTVFIKTQELINYIEIHTISGKLVDSKPIKSQQFYIKDMNQGVYLVTVYMKNNTFFTNLLYVK